MSEVQIIYTRFFGGISDKERLGRDGLFTTETMGGCREAS